MINEEQYIRENYGNCKVTPCQCILNKNWLGTLCQNWEPVKEKSFAERYEALRKQHAGRSKAS